ncbi:flotillin family protein [Neptuniibacter sp. QD37_11]|uniref:flotillin family protein n=1 Tax=Neptuniibacter sp. QD37_11 TaxID=3398209 RepID=UPI0039F4ED29
MDLFGDSIALTIAAFVVPAIVFIGFSIFMVKQYRRCQPNQVLVVYGKTMGNKSAKTIHGGGTFVIPLFQDYQYMSLEPMVLDVPLENGLSSNNIRVNIPTNVTVAISTKPEILQNAAERLLGLSNDQIKLKASEICIGQLRAAISAMTIDEITSDREKFITEVNTNIGEELAKIGIDLVTVNIVDITDESGYIEAVGKKAAAEAIEQAKIDVAEQEKKGEIGKSDAEREQQIAVAKNKSKAEQGTAAAEREKEVYVAQQNSATVQGENAAAQEIAQSNAELKVKEASANRQGEVATNEAEKAIFESESEKEKARLHAEEVVPMEIQREKDVIAADAAKQVEELAAKGEAAKILEPLIAKAEGERKLWEAKAEGFKKIVEAVGGNTEAAVQMLMVEQNPEITKIQSEAIQNVEFGKITVWDGGKSNGGNGGTMDFLSSLTSGLAPMHSMNEMAGVKAPAWLGTLINQSEETSPEVPTEAGNSGNVVEGTDTQSWEEPKAEEADSTQK